MINQVYSRVFTKTTRRIIDFFLALYVLLVWKELEKENKEFFETYKKDRGVGPNTNQEAATTTGHHPSRVQQSCCSQESTTTMLQQKNLSGEQEQRVVEKEKRELFETYKKDRGEESTLQKKNPCDVQEKRVVEKEKRKNPCASKSSHDN